MNCVVELVLCECPAVFRDESDIGSVTMDDDKIKEFCNITGAGAQVAQQLLQVCNGNLEMAINMHMEGETAFDVLPDYRSQENFFKGLKAKLFFFHWGSERGSFKH